MLVKSSGYAVGHDGRQFRARRTLARHFNPPQIRWLLELSKCEGKDPPAYFADFVHNPQKAWALICDRGGPPCSVQADRRVPA